MSSKTFSKRRYQPAAEFDDVTLARKREYWRSKKREQRARKSSSKKKIGNENLGLCKSVVRDEPVLQIPKGDNEPSLHNHADALRNSSSSGLSVSECNVTVVACQKERWFQKTKLTNVLPKFPETRTSSMKVLMGNTKMKSSVTGSLNKNAKTVESLCPIDHAMPTARTQLHPKTIRTQKTKIGISSLNGKQLTSPQSHVSKVLPVHNNQNKPQNCLRPLTSAECQFHKKQGLVHSHTTKKRKCAFALKHNTRVAMTEEEMAAKRRENWRIKKREQRAKRAAKLARDREGSQGQSSFIVKASSTVNSKALKGMNSSNPKCLNQQSFGVKCINSQTQLNVPDTKPNHSSLSSGFLQPSLSKSKVPKFAHTQKNSCQEVTRKSFLGASKVESSEDQHARQKEYWRIKKREQRARLSRAVKAQLKEQGTLKNCRRHYHNSFNEMYGVQESRSGAFASSSDKIGGVTVTIQPENPTEEERIARLREYWRIKKRKQRASRAGKLGNGLLRSKVSVLKQREQNQNSNKRDRITSSITKAAGPTPIQEHINPSIHAAFSIPEMTPCISVNDGKSSPSPYFESNIEPSGAANPYVTSLPAVASMKKILEESTVSTPKDNANKMHVECQNEHLLLTKGDLISEDTKPNITLQQNDLLVFDVPEGTSFKHFKMGPQAFPFEDISHHNSHNFCQEAADGSHDLSPVAVQPQCRNTQKFSDDGADPKESCPLQALQKQQFGESDELQRKREYWRLMKRQQRARKANNDAAKDPNTEKERITRLREYWMIKKREQRASRSALLGNGLLKSKVSVLKQREQKKKLDKRDRITSSIIKTVALTSAPTPKQENTNPPIHAAFSILEITPCISFKDIKPSPDPSFESHIEPQAAANHYSTTLQAVASMKKLLEESVSTPEDNNATKMHVKSENEPVQLTKGDLTSEDTKLNVTLQKNDLLECEVSEDKSLVDFKMSLQTFPFEDTSHHNSHNFFQEPTDGSHDLSPVAVQPQCRNNQKLSDDGADPKNSCPSQVLQKQQFGESDELQRKREYWRLMKRRQRARKANKDANNTEKERITRLREYWMIKKREQRASQAARLGNGLLKSKVSVLKQREQNKKSNKRDRIISSIIKTAAPTPIQEHIYPSINAVFSIPEMNPFTTVKNCNPSPCPSLESHIEPPQAANHYANTLLAVVSIKKLLEVSTPDNNDADVTHVKCENEPLLLNQDDLLTSEDAKPNATLQQNVLLECDVSEDTSLEDFKMSPQALKFEDVSHHNSHNFCPEAADGSHDLSPVAVQPQCRNTQKFSDDGADPKQSCPLQALQKQPLGESDELQRKRAYWRLRKRQQRARKANKDAVLCSLAPLTQTASTTLIPAMSQDTSTCKQICIQRQTRRCTKPTGPQTQPSDKTRNKRSQIVEMTNPQDDPQEVIRRRRMQWRIKKQKQRARKAANERKLHQVQNTTSFCSAVDQSIQQEDQLSYLAEPCQTALKESSFAPNDATKGPLSKAEWRNIYLMDSDPVNLLLVCMVCGEQQYCLSVEAAKAHIEEVHPDTLSLGDLEHQGILDAWDQQVAVRERSITQLQQRCRAPTGDWKIYIQSGLENKK